VTRDTDPAYAAAGSPKPSMIWISGVGYADNPVLYKPAKPDPLVDSVADAQIVSMMQGVVQQGTGIKVAAVGKPLAGKTGTTSDWNDAWFVGFSPDLVAGAYVGFDTPRTLGDGETGGNVAAPIFRDFMADALKDQPAIPFPENSAGEMVMINSISGQPTIAGDKDAVLEPYRPGTGPNARYGGQIAAGRGYPSPQEAADAVNGGGDPVAGMPGAQMANVPSYPVAAGMPMSNAQMANAPISAGSMPNAMMGAGQMMPVNARMPGGGGVAAPPRTILTGTGGLY
jgi:penicillin-binding protein 1A